MNWEGFLSLTRPGRGYLELVCTCVLSHFSHVRLFATPWTVGCQAPLSMAFSGQEYWSGLPCPPPGDLLDSEIEPTSPVPASLQADYC